MPNKKSRPRLGDVPPNGRTKAHPPFFDSPEPPLPDFQQTPRSTSEQKAKQQLADSLEQYNERQDELDARARTAEDAHRYFESLALQGSQEAAEYLLLLAWKSIKSLETILKNNPSTIQKIAARQILWPCLVSNKPILNALNNEHIKNLGLGREIGINIKARWDINKPYSKHAHELLMRLDSIEICQKNINALKPIQSKKAAELIDALLHKLGEDKELLGKIPQARLSKVTLKDYTPILRQMFRQRYPHPEQLKEFGNVKNNPNRKSSAEKQAKIFDQVRQAVKSMLMP